MQLLQGVAYRVELAYLALDSAIAIVKDSKQKLMMQNGSYSSAMEAVYRCKIQNDFWYYGQHSCKLYSSKCI
jgi:hypothetical protein